MALRRTKSGRFVSRRRIVRRNPAKRTKHHSAAMRRKIGLAVKRAMAGRRSRPSSKRRSIRQSAPVAVARRSFGRGSHHSPEMRRKIGLAVRRANASRRGGGGRSLVRSSFRSSGGIIGSLKSSFNRPILMKAGGAVVASIGTGMILRKFATTLPLANAKYGKAAYSLIIPSLAAYFVQRKSRDLAEGLVIGGVVMAITEIIKNVSIPGVPAGSLGSYGVAGELGYGAYPVGSDLDTLGAPLVTPAFPDSAW